MSRFRYRLDDAHRLNARIAIELQESGVAAPSTTVIGGKLALRAAIVNHHTQERDLDALLDKTLARGRSLTDRIAQSSPPQRNASTNWAPHLLLAKALCPNWKPASRLSPVRSSHAWNEPDCRPNWAVLWTPVTHTSICWRARHPIAWR